MHSKLIITAGYCVVLALAGAAPAGAWPWGIGRCLPDRSDAALRPYREWLREHDHVLRATRLCEDFAEPLRKRVWDYLRRAEERRSPLEVALPEGFDSQEVGSTAIRVEPRWAVEVQAARIGHALWLERRGGLPWSLAEFPEDDLKSIFHDPDVTRWNTGARVQYLMDHSPLAAWKLARAAVGSQGLRSMRAAVEAIVDSTRDFRHGSQDADYRRVETLGGMRDLGISIYGCQTLVPYVVHLATRMNIPARSVRGYYGEVSHRTALFPAAGAVLTHGDDVYNKLLRDVPSVELLDDYDHWRREVLPLPRNSRATAHAAGRHNVEMAARYPSDHLVGRYCRDGREELERVFGEHFSAGRIDRIEERLAGECQ